MSSRSLSKRGFVQKELRLALEVMDELPPETVFVIPIRLDSCSPTEEKIRDLQWLDLSPSYEVAISKLISAVRPRASGSESKTSTADVDRCLQCGSPVPDSVDRCIACFRDVGAPNVRCALAERSELEARYATAIERSNAAGHLTLARELERYARTSDAVIGMSPSSLRALLQDRNVLYSAYATLVQADSQSPFTKARSAIEAKLFPGYSGRIVYANLSTSERGVRSYGAVSAVLNDIFIEHRTTVLERNSFEFVGGHLLTEELPKGFVSGWRERHKLAVAKLGNLIGHRGRPADDEWLLQDHSTRAEDYMEVHIYGSITATAIKSVSIMANPETRGEALEIDTISQLAAKRGIPVHHVPTAGIP
jgi:hypothetical protein